jgi:predicted phage terminase large subunit-like protein
MPSSSISQKAAATELLRRRLARQSLISFTRFTFFPEYRPAPHHHRIAEVLEAVERGEKRRVMIFMPPRHGKSELASRRFPAYFIGRNPDRSIIAASYNSDLASDFGREVRNIVGSKAYADLFNVHLAEDSSARDRWHTEKGGMYSAAGVGTATTGRGAHVFLIDDPVKDRESADSEIIRERTYRWYTSTAYTRLESDIDNSELLEDDWLWRDLQNDIEAGRATKLEGAIVLIQTRWHDDDLAGRLLLEQQRGGDQWEILELPAIREEGDTRLALWPGKYPLRRLDEIRMAIGERDWSALYQQRPAPDEGVYFKREWFNWYDQPPEHLTKYGASDYAVKGKSGDWTVHVVAGVDPEDNLYILDVWRKQTTSDVWVDAFLDLADQHKPMVWAEEDGQIIKSLGPFIDRRSQERGVYCYREQFVSVADKPTRCRSFQARCAMRKVYLPRNATWIGDVLGELLSFPAGRTDDIADACGLLGRLLDKMFGASVATVEEKTVADYHGMEGFNYLDDGFDGEDTWRTI